MAVPDSSPPVTKNKSGVERTVMSLNAPREAGGKLQLELTVRLADGEPVLRAGDLLAVDLRQGVETAGRAAVGDVEIAGLRLDLDRRQSPAKPLATVNA